LCAADQLAGSSRRCKIDFTWFAITFVVNMETPRQDGHEKREGNGRHQQWASSSGYPLRSWGSSLSCANYRTSFEVVEAFARAMTTGTAFSIAPK
jgi:hypothetical protein